MMLCSILAIKQCHHDLFQRGIDLVEINSDLLETKPHNINIYFDFDNIKNGNDQFACKNAGQIINWNLTNVNYTCEANDFLSKEKIEALIKTADNAREYVSQRIQINREMKQIKPIIFSDFPINNTYSPNADLFVTLCVRPIQNQFNTNIGSVYKQINNGRPIQGVIFIDPKSIPDTAQGVDTFNRNLYNNLLHQIIHLLGFSKTVFPQWLNHNTLKNVYMDQYKTTFYVIDSEITRKFMKDRFGNPEIDGINGIELESYNESYTSHTSGVTFYTDIMNSLQLKDLVFSDATKAVLESTGWYKVSEKVEYLPWGDGKSLKQDKMKDFPFSAPQDTYPSNYLCSADQTGEVCSYDYKGKANCAADTKFDCSNPKFSDFCKRNSYTNPKGSKLISSNPQLAYQNMKIHNGQLCTSSLSQTNKSHERKESFGADSFCTIANDGNEQFAGCYQMYCDDFGFLLLKVGKKIHHCTEGKTIKSGKLTINCPPPKHICGIGKPNNFYAKLLILILIYAILLMAILISCIVLCCYCRSLKIASADLPADRTVDIPLVV